MTIKATATLICLLIALQSTITVTAHASTINIERLATAIYKAEGGSSTKHPWGILTIYKHTTPHQACVNTIKHALRDYHGSSVNGYIAFLGNRYCPINSNTDNGTCKFWVNNVTTLYNKG